MFKSKRKRFLKEVKELENQIEILISFIDNKKMMASTKATKLLRWHDSTSSMISSLFGFTEQLKFLEVAQLGGLESRAIEDLIEGDSNDVITGLCVHIKALVEEAIRKPELFISKWNKRETAEVAPWTWTNIKEHPIGIIIAVSLFWISVTWTVSEVLRVSPLQNQLLLSRDNLGKAKEELGSRASFNQSLLPEFEEKTTQLPTK